MINENDYINSKTLSNNLDKVIQEEANILKWHLKNQQKSNSRETIAYV